MNRRSFVAAVASLVGGLVNFKLLPCKAAQPDKLLGADSGFPFVDEVGFSSPQEVKCSAYFDVDITYHFRDGTFITSKKDIAVDPTWCVTSYKTTPMIRLTYSWMNYRERVVYDGPLPEDFDMRTLEACKPFKLGNKWFKLWDESRDRKSIRPD